MSATDDFMWELEAVAREEAKRRDLDVTSDTHALFRMMIVVYSSKKLMDEVERRMVEGDGKPGRVQQIAREMDAQGLGKEKPGER